MIRWLLIGGYLHGNEGERHFVGPARLVELYGLPPEECILAASDDDPKLRGLRTENFTVLRPDPSGWYDPTRRS